MQVHVMAIKSYLSLCSLSSRDQVIIHGPYSSSRDQKHQIIIIVMCKGYSLP